MAPHTCETEERGRGFELDQIVLSIEQGVSCPRDQVNNQQGDQWKTWLVGGCVTTSLSLS